MSAYTEKFKDPRWQKKRLEILERDGWACKSCGNDKSTLHVHHKWYIGGNDPWDYPDNCLATLCEECHETEHSGSVKEEVDALKIELLGKGFFLNDFLTIAEAVNYSTKEEIEKLMRLSVRRERDKTK